LPSGLGAPSADPGAPLTPDHDIPWLEPFPDARVGMDQRADLRLAFVAAIQLLPPRQRAVLVLRDVLDFSAAEVATQLATTVAAVNSGLQRARATLADAPGAGELREPEDPQARAVVDRYVRAFESADVSGLVRLLAEDAVLEMPPVPLWYHGRRHYEAFMIRVFAMRGTGWAVTPLTANSQPAFAAYAPGSGGPLTLHTLQVLTVRDGRVRRNVVFADERVFTLFDLPRTIPARTSHEQR
jgi:RNA polymerase sigma-70 factor (ECF subfamily)